MDLLQQARAEIDAVDAEMAALFERRMQAVADVVRYKAETGKPVFDAAREADVITRNTARLHNEELRPYYKAFLQEAMAVSRAYQRPLWAATPPLIRAWRAHGATLPCGGCFPLPGPLPLPPGPRCLTLCRTATPSLVCCPLKIPTRGCFRRAGPAVHPPGHHCDPHAGHAHPSRTCWA